MKNGIKFYVLSACLLAACLLFAACGGNRGHKVEFDVRGGKAIATVYTLDEMELPSAEREGYTFEGWYTELDESGNPKGDRLGDRFKPEKGVKLYANWLPFTLEEVYDGYELSTVVSATTRITIPAEYGGYKITSVGSGAFAACTNLQSVELPESVNRIGSNAFKGTALASIDLNGKVREVGDGAFENCASLTEADLTGVSVIGSAAFKGCVKLKTLSADPEVSVAADSFEGCTALAVKEGGINYINNCAVSADADITAVTLKQGTKAVWAHAFENKAELAQIDLTGVEFVGDYAFYGCKKLSGITWGTTVKTVGVNAFYDCVKLETVTLPDSVTKLGAAAFYGCTQLGSVTLAQSLQKLDTNAFYGCTRLQTVNLGGCTEIGVSAFESCAELDSVNLQNVTGIGARAFKNCTSLSAADLSGLSVLHSEAFAATALTSVTLPQSCKTVANGAFRDCKNLTGVSLADGTEIGVNAFRGCTQLAVIDLSGVSKIGANSFDGCKLTQVDLGASLTHIGTDAFKSCNITKVSYGGSILDWIAVDFRENSNPITISGNLYIGDERVTELILVGDDERTVESIGAYAFDGLGNISKMVLDSNITSIGLNAFGGCTFTEIYYTGDAFGFGYISYDDEEQRLTDENVWYYSEFQPQDDGKYWHYVDNVITKW